MRATVVPAVNASTSIVARKRLALVGRLGCPVVQIDCADGRFVRHRTLGPEATGALPGRVGIELHLMVEAPDRWLPTALKLHVARVAFHVETLSEPRPLIAALRVHRIAAIAAIGPDTSLGALTALRGIVGGYLLLGVPPGPSGSTLHPRTLHRIRDLRRRLPRAEISVDGGVDRTNLRALRDAGATRFVVGSAIFGAADPISAYRELVRL